MSFLRSVCLATLLCGGGSENCITNNGVVYQIQGEARKALVIGRDRRPCDGLIDLSIPDRVEGLDVVGVKDDAFLNDFNLRSITMGLGLLKIGNRAFKGCSGLERLYMPDSIMVLGHEAFMGCVRIGEVKLPGVLTDDSGSWAFRGCDNLKRVVISDDLTCDVVPFFSGCSGLQEFQVGSNQLYQVIDGCLYADEGRVFVRCPNVSNLSNVSVRAGVRSIADFAFFGCCGLRHVSLPDSIHEIGMNAFCMSGIEEVSLPDAIESLNMEAFAGCTNLHCVDMPLGIKYIGINCFSGAHALRQIVFKGDRPEIEEGGLTIGAEGCVVIVPEDAHGWDDSKRIWGLSIRRSLMSGPLSL